MKRMAKNRRARKHTDVRSYPEIQTLRKMRKETNKRFDSLIKRMDSLIVRVEKFLRRHYKLHGIEYDEKKSKPL